MDPSLENCCHNASSHSICSHLLQLFWLHSEQNLQVVSVSGEFGIQGSSTCLLALISSFGLAGHIEAVALLTAPFVTTTALLTIQHIWDLLCMLPWSPWVTNGRRSPPCCCLLTSDNEANLARTTFVIGLCMSNDFCTPLVSPSSFILTWNLSCDSVQASSTSFAVHKQND